MDVISGNIPMTFVSMGPHIQFVRKGAIRVLGGGDAKAHAISARRADLRRAGLSGLRGDDVVRAVCAPRHGMEIVDQLNAYVRELNDDPAAKGRLEANFVDPRS